MASLSAQPTCVTQLIQPIGYQRNGVLVALEQVRRMRGGSQAHLMRCSDGNYYVVKFQNNPQHRRILVNEFMGTKLAAGLGLPTAQVAIVEVSEELIRLTHDLVMEMPRNRVPCLAGLQFGSRFPGDPRRLTLHDFLPDEQLRHVANIHDFVGMLVFDKWTCNTDGRQTLFFRSSANGGRQAIDSLFAPYSTLMIDQGFCFNAGEWNFPDAPLRGLYARHRVYEGITGIESFAPWLERLEKQMTERALEEIVREIPPAWYGDDRDALARLSEELLRRRSHVEELIVAAMRSNRQPFPNWIPKRMWSVVYKFPLSIQR